MAFGLGCLSLEVSKMWRRLSHVGNRGYSKASGVMAAHPQEVWPYGLLFGPIAFTLSPPLARKTQNRQRVAP